MLFVDCELQNRTVTHFKLPVSYTCQELSRTITWHSFQDEAQASSSFYANVLGPICNVMGYFAADLGGLGGVAELLGKYIEENTNL
jgi:hypothetical protein